MQGHSRTRARAHALLCYTRCAKCAHVAQAFYDDRVVELRVQLGVEDEEGKDWEEKLEVEREKRVKEGALWMTLEMVVMRLRT